MMNNGKNAIPKRVKTASKRAEWKRTRRRVASRCRLTIEMMWRIPERRGHRTTSGPAGGKGSDGYRGPDRAKRHAGPAEAIRDGFLRSRLNETGSAVSVDRLPKLSVCPVAWMAAGRQKNAGPRGARQVQQGGFTSGRRRSDTDKGKVPDREAVVVHPGEGLFRITTT